MARRAGDLKTHSASLPMLFPKGSIHGPSEALPKIWEDFEEFNRISSDVESAATVLSSLKKANALRVALSIKPAKPAIRIIINHEKP